MDYESKRYMDRLWDGIEQSLMLRERDVDLRDLRAYGIRNDRWQWRGLTIDERWASEVVLMLNRRRRLLRWRVRRAFKWLF